MVHKQRVFYQLRQSVQTHIEGSSVNKAPALCRVQKGPHQGKDKQTNKQHNFSWQLNWLWGYKSGYLFPIDYLTQSKNHPRTPSVQFHMIIYDWTQYLWICDLCTKLVNSNNGENIKFKQNVCLTEKYHIKQFNLNS